MTLTPLHDVPAGIARQQLDGKWEAYQIRTIGNAVWLVGSNFRGTAFAAYTLSERLGIDPLYIWTGYAPDKHSTLVLKQTDFLAGSPTFKFRGFFHDDEDILPRPFDENGYPLQTGTVPRIWYERFFETALRLRMNMVAPYVRVQRSVRDPEDGERLGLDLHVASLRHARVESVGVHAVRARSSAQRGHRLGLVQESRRPAELLARRRAREPRSRRLLAGRAAWHPGPLVHVP